jgi:hypothetical protein
MTCYNLNRGQVRRQFVTWKSAKYDFANTVIVATREELRDGIAQILSTTVEEFVIETLEELIAAPRREHNNGSHAEEQDARFFEVWHNAMPQHTHLVRKWIDSGSTGPEVCALGKIVKFYNAFAAEIFPQTAKSVSGSEMAFIAKRLEMRSEFCESNWMPMKPMGDNGVCEEIQSTVFIFLEQCLFFAWSRMQLEGGYPEIIFPEEDCVSRFAKATVYYTGSWTLSRVDKAPTVYNKTRRQCFKRFAASHNLSVEDAEKESLPTGVIKKRGFKSLFRASRTYFDFICRIESVFLANLTLEKMIAYSNGDLLIVIKEALLEHSAMNEEFADLCFGIQGLAGDATECRHLLDYILTKFTRMRGQAFAKSMKGQIGKSLDVIDKSATRIKVAAKAAASRTAAEAVKKLYASTESAIVQLPDDNEIEIDDENEVSDSNSE